jgi:hypothetical protein
MNESERSRLDQMLDLLAAEVAERLAARSEPPPVAAPPPASEMEGPAQPPEPESPPEPEPPSEPEPAPEPGPEFESPSEPEPPVERPPAPPVHPHAARLMGRLAFGLLILVVMINIPFNRHGTTLATAMPDSRSLIIRDGLVVKEENAERIYVYQNGEFRWISSMDAFEHFRYTWGDVHIVEEGFLEDYEIGPPLHVLLKCGESPHIYRLEGGEKRWIVDITAFEAEGHVWEDVRFVPCGYLRDLPDGETIPPGHGPPPEP